MDSFLNKLQLVKFCCKIVEGVKQISRKMMARSIGRDEPSLQSVSAG